MHARVGQEPELLIPRKARVIQPSRSARQVAVPTKMRGSPTPCSEPRPPGAPYRLLLSVAKLPSPFPALGRAGDSLSGQGLLQPEVHCLSRSEPRQRKQVIP